ncbi:MAG TPA: iron ABC transporter permease [Gemmatimonadales bacterium]|nr:iron ABC transporter permease [Gemmatimonadales bacterium]
MSRRAPWAAAALTLLLSWLIIYPLVVVFAEAAGADLGTFVRDRVAREALWGSLWTSAASVVLAAAVGIPLAFIFERYDFPGRAVLGTLVALPAVMPPLVGVIAFLFLYGESGFVSRAIQALAGSREAPWQLQGAGAILLVHAYSMYAYFYMFTRAGLARLDASVLEAAASLGAGRFETFRRVTLPLLRPALVGASLLTFMTALASFSAPYIFGGGFRVMTTQIVATRLNGDIATAMLETAALTALALLGFALVRWTERGERSYAAVGKGAPPALRPITRPLARVLAAAAGWLFAVLLLLPHLTLILISLVPLNSWTTETLPPALSTINYRRLFTEAERLGPMVNSLWMAAVATAASLALAVWAAHLVVRRRSRLAGAIETLVALPWAVPGTVLAIALATMFAVNSPLTGRLVLVGTAFILPIAYTVRNLPLTGRAVLAGFRQLDPALEEAAESLGAGRLRRLWKVTLPLLRPALAAGGSLAFVTALGDFVVSVLLYPNFQLRPISIEIISAMRFNDLGLAAAFGVVLMLVSALALGVGGRVGR